MLASFLSTLHRRAARTPLTLEVLSVEVVEHNELTAILEAKREAWGDETTRLLGGEAFTTRPYMRGVPLLLVASVQYLALRSRKIRLFGSVDLRNDEGWGN